MPISDTRIWTGSEWQSLVGPTGPAGPIVVSANAGNLAKLGTDNRVLVAQADLDARYVNVTGDTMSGGLTIQQESEVAVLLRTYSNTFNAVVRFQRFRGTIAAPVVLQPLDHIGRFTYATNDASGTLRTSAFSCTAVQIAATGVETQYSFIVSLSTGLTVAPLLVTKDGISVTGNITSTGTAHNFAANSITASAILGLPVGSAVLPLVDAATAVVGVSTAYARADHVHPLPTAAQIGGLTQAQADTRYVNVAGDTVTGDLIVNGKLGVGVTPIGGFHVKADTIILDGYTSTVAVAANAPPGFGGIGVIDSQGILLANATAATGSYTAVFARTRGTDTNPAVPRDGDFAFRSEGPAPSQLGGALSVAGNITSTGTAHSFANASIPNAAVAPPASDCNFYQAGRTITAADRGKIIVNNSSNSTLDVTFILPADSVFPIGTRLDFVDASNAETWIQAPAGGQIVYSTALTAGGGAGTSVTITGRVRLATPYFRLTAIKVKDNQWILLN